MKAMFYEYLIRDAFECGRNLGKGADASIYREMERNHFAVTNPNVPDDKEDKQYKFRESFAAVRINVDRALRYSLKNGLGRSSDKIKAFIAELMLDFYDKERLDQIIEEAGQLLRMNKS